jgi:hypothetical protein
MRYCDHEVTEIGFPIEYLTTQAKIYYKKEKRFWAYVTMPNCTHH